MGELFLHNLSRVFCRSLVALLAMDVLEHEDQYLPTSKLGVNESVAKHYEPQFSKLATVRQSKSKRSPSADPWSQTCFE